MHASSRNLGKRQGLAVVCTFIPSWLALRHASALTFTKIGHLPAGTETNFGETHPFRLLRGNDASLASLP